MHAYKIIKNYTNKIGLNNNFLIKILLLFVFCFSIINFWKIGIVESDSLMYSNLSLQCGKLCPFSYFLKGSISQGRLTILGGFWYSLVYFVNNFLYFKFITIVLILLNIILFSYFLKEIFCSKKIFFISILLFSVTLQNSWQPNALFFYPGLFTGSINIFLLSLIFLILFLKKRKIFFIIFSCFFYIISLLTYEVYLLYLPLFLFIILCFSKNKKRFKFKIFLPYLIASFIYLFVYYIVRKSSNNIYIGANFSNTLNIRDMLHVIKQFSFASIPGYMFFNDKWSIANNIFSDSILKNKDFYNKFNILWLFRAMITSFIYFLLINKNKFKISNNNIFIKIIIGIYCFFIPPFFLSLTDHYVWISKGIFLSEPITYYSYFSFIFLLILLIILGNNIFKKGKLFNIIVITVTFIMCLLNDYTNYSYGISQAKSNDKWFVIKSLINNDIFLEINNACIISPSIFETKGTLVINDKNYWSNYIRTITHKNLEIVENSIDCNLKDNLFYLNLSDNNKYYIFRNNIELPDWFVLLTNCNEKIDLNNELYNLKILYNSYKVINYKDKYITRCLIDVYNARREN